MGYEPQMGRIGRDHLVGWVLHVALRSVYVNQLSIFY